MADESLCRWRAASAIESDRPHCGAAVREVPNGTRLSEPCASAGRRLPSGHLVSVACVEGTTDRRCAQRLRQVAGQAADVLGAAHDILSVCLIGSVARGDAGPDSDIDLLVVTERKLRRSDLLMRLPPSAQDPRLSLISYSREDLTMEATSGSLFLHHVRLEGVTMHDRHRTLCDVLDIAAARAPNVSAEFDRQLRRLRLYREPERLNGEHLFALAHLYAIGKAVAIARCVALDEPVFRRSEALKAVADHHPDLADDVAAIVELEPFYDLTRDRVRGPLPFAPTNVEHKLRRVGEAIERVASV